MVPLLSGARSFRQTFSERPQFMRGLEPVFFRRSLRTSSGFPETISQRGDVLVPKGGDAVFVHRGLMRLLGMLVRFLGVLQSLPERSCPVW